MRHTLPTWAKHLRPQRWVQLPSQCAICHTWPAQRLCGDCLLRFAAPQPRCQSCACWLPGGATHCGECLRQPPLLHTCLAAVDYGYPWRHIIGQFKFQADPSWAGSLAQLLLAAPTAPALLAQADWVLPIPLASARLQQRGYNQALLLASACASHRVHRQLLLRLRDTAAQHQLPRAQRLRNLQGTFSVEPLLTHLVAGKTIVLIDDVMTTGATLNAAAQALLQAGASRVNALVLARTPG